MRLLILPFDDKHQPLKNDIYELESSSRKEILKSLNLVMKERSYQVQVYKNSKDFIFFQLDEHVLISHFNYNDKTYYRGSKTNPYESMIKTVDLYLSHQGSTVLERDFKNEEEQKRKYEKEKYETWKKGYTKQLKKEKKLNIQRTILVSAIIGFIAIFAYLIWIDELRFLGRETEKINAVIIKTGLYHIGKGYYKQRVTYQFEFQGQNHIGRFNAGRRLGFQQKGDSVRVKFVTSNPEISKRTPWH